MSFSTSSVSSDQLSPLELSEDVDQIWKSQPIQKQRRSTQYCDRYELNSESADDEGSITSNSKLSTVSEVGREDPELFNHIDANDYNLEKVELTDSSTDNIVIKQIPEYNPNRDETQREKALKKERKREISKQKAYTQVIKLSYKNLTFLLCYTMISVAGFFYPFNVFEKLMQVELGIIPSNISFICSAGTGCFFMFGGFYGIFYDRYGCSWGLYIGSVLSFIGNLSLSASFQQIIRDVSFAELSLQSSTTSAGYGLIYMTCLLVIIKSVSNRHRGKVNGFTQAIWIMGSSTTPLLNGAIFSGVEGHGDYIAEEDAKDEGKMVLFRGIWTALLFIAGSFIIREEPSKWYMHRHHEYKPYFKERYNIHFTMKQFGSFRFVCLVLMGSLMMCGCYFYPSQITLVLDSFNERSYAPVYKQTISYISACTSLITGIGIDLLKFHQRPALFMLFAIVLCFIANSMLIFNMYDTLLISAGINAIGMGLFWATYPVMMSDIYGLSNLGTNLGVTFVIGGLLCGLLQTLAGEWYAKTIDDTGVRCNGAPCFREALIINQSFISFSFVLLMTLRARIREKKDIRTKGVLDVRYYDGLAEKDYIESRMVNSELFQDRVKADDVWNDGRVIFSDNDTKNIYLNEILSPVDMKSAHSSTDWSSNQDGIIQFADDLTANVFNKEIENKGKKRRKEKEDSNSDNDHAVFGQAIEMSMMEDESDDVDDESENEPMLKKVQEYSDQDREGNDDEIGLLDYLNSN